MFILPDPVYLALHQARNRVSDAVIEKSQIWSQFESLPPAAQRQVADFIAFLNARIQRDRGTRDGAASLPLRDEGFVGLWKEREDLSDSAAWVRQLRREEWRGPVAIKPNCRHWTAF